MLFKKVAIASDHAGSSLKEGLVVHLRENKHDVVDLGPSASSNNSVDYPDYASKIAELVMKKEVDGGIAICGTGIGMSIVANKFPGIRAACPWDLLSCEMARRHNDVNFLCLGARMLSKALAISLLETWLSTLFEGGRHQKRLDKIIALDKRGF